MFKKDVDQYLTLLSNQLYALDMGKREQIIAETREALNYIISQNKHIKNFSSILISFPNAYVLANYHLSINKQKIKPLKAFKVLNFYKGCILPVIILFAVIFIGLISLKSFVIDFFNKNIKNSSFHYSTSPKPNQRREPPEIKNYISIFKGEFTTSNLPDNLISLNSFQGKIYIESVLSDKLTYNCKGKFHHSQNILFNEDNNWKFNFDNKDEIDCVFAIPNKLGINLKLNNGQVSYIHNDTQENYYFEFIQPQGSIQFGEELNSTNQINSDTTKIKIEVINGSIKINN